MSVKGWLRQKIRNAAGVEYLEYNQSALHLELEKLSGIQAEQAARGEARQDALRQELVAGFVSQSERVEQAESALRAEAQGCFAQMENRLAAIEETQSTLRETLEQGMKQIHATQEQLINEIKCLRDELRQDVDAARGHREYLQSEFNRIGNEVHVHVDMVGRDTLMAAALLPVDGNPLEQRSIYQVCTNYPIAYSSPDHLHPWGTKNDNTRAPFFIHKCETLFPDKSQLRFADLGCSGGGIVLDAVLRGHIAIGLEGSDYSLKHQRAEWRLLKNCLFTCDIGKPFDILDQDGNPAQFDIVSAWEVFEHIPQDGVPQLMRNIEKMLAPGGYLVGTVSQTDDHEPESGVSLHLTTMPAEWWYGQGANAGLVRIDGVFETCDLARAYGNPPLPWYSNWNCEMSPYIVLQKPMTTVSV